MNAPARLAASLALLFPIAAVAQETKTEDRVQKGEGVIVKVEPLKEAKGEARRVRVTINAAAPWRDWVRDQTAVKPGESPKAGADSVATKGDPVDSTNSVIVEVGPTTRVLTRFRSSTDETNPGSATPEKAAKKDAGTGEPEASDRDDKAPKTEAKDLKVGQFVEFDARGGRAGKLVVLRPVGGADTPASEAKPDK